MFQEVIFGSWRLLTLECDWLITSFHFFIPLIQTPINTGPLAISPSHPQFCFIIIFFHYSLFLSILTQSSPSSYIFNHFLFCFSNLLYDFSHSSNYYLICISFTYALSCISYSNFYCFASFYGFVSTNPGLALLLAWVLIYKNLVSTHNCFLII